MESTGLTPENLSAFVITPLYGFRSDASRLDITPSAYLAKYHEAMFEDVLAEGSDLLLSFRNFPPDFLMTVAEELKLEEVPSLLHTRPKQSAEVLGLLIGIFQSSILASERLVTALRLYQKGCLQRGATEVVMNLPHNAARLQMQMSVLAGTLRPKGLDWVGGEGPPYPLSDEETFSFQATELPDFSLFFKLFSSVFDRGQLRTHKKLDLAIAYYNRSYGIAWRAEALICLFTCLESLLMQQGEELSHRLSVRTANLLGGNAAERRKIHADIKEFYEARSKLIHGDILKERLSQRLAQVEVLRDHVRRTILMMLSLGNSCVSPTEVYRLLDEMSLDDSVRKELQEKGSLLLHPRP